MNISMSSRTDLKKLYFNVFMTYNNTDLTLEDIGMQYGITKQRVWQIIRFCKLGNGDYYRGLSEYNKVYRSFLDETQDRKSANYRLREWLKLKNIRTIKNNKVVHG
tara:strand:- start:6365 stop:6682 length:318 start_codon:yes stop_codon:yes gene_type:complete